MDTLKFTFPVNNGNEIARNYLFAALVKLLNEKPINRISIVELCQQAGVSRSSFYWNFDSKEDMLRKYFNSQFLVLVRHLQKVKKQSQVDLYEYFFNYLHWHSELIDHLIKNNMENFLRDHLYSYISHLMKKSIIRETGVSHDFRVSFLSGGITEILVIWSDHNFKESSKQMSCILDNLLNKV